jgi:hypothetical protein
VNWISLKRGRGPFEWNKLLNNLQNYGVKGGGKGIDIGTISKNLYPIDLKQKLVDGLVVRLVEIAPTKFG